VTGVQMCSSDLAYEVKHETEGRYFLYTFNAEANHVAEIERLLRINASVLKYMIIKK
jgi:ribosomal protein S6